MLTRTLTPPLSNSRVSNLPAISRGMSEGLSTSDSRNIEVPSSRRARVVPPVNARYGFFVVTFQWLVALIEFCHQGSGNPVPAPTM